MCKSDVMQPEVHGNNNLFKLKCFEKTYFKFAKFELKSLILNSFTKFNMQATYFIYIYTAGQAILGRERLDHLIYLLYLPCDGCF